MATGATLSTVLHCGELAAVYLVQGDRFVLRAVHIGPAAWPREKETQINVATAHGLMPFPGASSAGVPAMVALAPIASATCPCWP